jgi:hypothetical protein
MDDCASGRRALEAFADSTDKHLRVSLSTQLGIPIDPVVLRAGCCARVRTTPRIPVNPNCNKRSYVALLLPGDRCVEPS